MTEMTEIVGAPVPRSKFERFLLASIGDDSNDNGMELSVLSALARQNIDPWDEAAGLARLPSDTATQRLASLIALLPKGHSTRPDPSANAARLIALLPRGVSPDNRSRTTVLGRAAPQSGTGRRASVYVVTLVIMLVLQWFIATHLGAGPRGQASAQTTGAVSSPATGLRNTGQ